jgi:UDP-N-acetylglucosamine/UDP-N-acetylgalactosamine diphosphorylase
MSNLESRYQAYCQKLAKCSQSHLLAFWPQLDDQQRSQLLDDLDQIDFARCAPLIASHVRRRPEVRVSQRIKPAQCYPAPPEVESQPKRGAIDFSALYPRARQSGEEAICAGRVAAFTVAGGQGTRLGYNGPKGAFRITPVRDAPLFQVFAEGLLGTQRRYGICPRWYIMTSLANHAETVRFFEQNKYFGLSRSVVRFFPQGQMPAFLPDGRIALAERHRVALSPDGHGGSLRALADHDAVREMREHGIDVISYFQVDNPLVRVIDPLFIGLHLVTGSEMSSMAVRKAYDEERVGVFCQVGSRIEVVEYSDMPEDLMRARNEDGTRRFDAGSIAIHILSRALVERLTSPSSAVQLPWHRADKKVATVDDAGNPVNLTAPNAVKLEMFVFDAIPLACNPLILYTTREEEFSPVKNADGVDSPATARRDLIRRAARWLETSGVNVPRAADGEPALRIEISPAFALDVADLQQQLKTPPVLTTGKPALFA